MTRFKLKIILLTIIIVSSLVLIYGNSMREEIADLNNENWEVSQEVIVLMEANDRMLLEHQEEMSNMESKIEGLESELKRVKNELGEAKNVKPATTTNNESKPKEEPSRSGRRYLGMFEATAYSDNVESQGEWVGQTATGMSPQVGVIAVDPNVIPLHTKLYVEGYGNCIAGDTGGAIKGYRIDLFKNTRDECRQWGRQSVKVYIRE